MYKHTPLLLLGTLAIGLCCLGCTGTGGGSSTPHQTGQPILSENGAFYIDTLYAELDNPWGMAWLPDGKLLVSERKGEILVFDNDRYTGEQLEGFPETYERGQGGLLDIQPHPNYPVNGWIYAHRSEEQTSELQSLMRHSYAVICQK